jgi:hypothetical protein
MKLIGYAFQTGRIDFTREDNPWAFSRIDAGMKQSQRDRILVDPTQAPVELRSAAVNDEPPEWMEEVEGVLRSADSMYLQYKSGVLRFRRANHEAGANRQFVTLGNQDEFDLYASEHWQNIRYLYALRRPNAYCFDVSTMITHKIDPNQKTTRIEMPAKLDLTDPSGEPMISFDATGSTATIEIVEWRGSVKEGEIGRYAPEDSHLEFNVKLITRPFTFLHEDRKEFRNHSYAFRGEKMRGQLKRLVKKKLAAIEKEDASSETAES